MLNEIDLSRADLNLLVLFEAVLAERHVGRAADKLNLTASAVSHGLGRLRKLLNDPMFLRTPKGVVPTARAIELAEPVAEILARIRNVVATAEPFDPAKSTRRFMLGAPDGALAVFLPELLAALSRSAPGVDIGMQQLLPAKGARTVERAWDPTMADLEARQLDVAVIPIDTVPARFVARTLFEEDFVVATRPGHPFARDPTLDRFCEQQHLLVSSSGDPYGFFDMASRRPKPLASGRRDGPEFHDGARRRRGDRPGGVLAAAAGGDACRPVWRGGERNAAIASAVDRPRGCNQGCDDGRRHCLAGRYPRTGIAGRRAPKRRTPQAAFRLNPPHVRQGRRFHSRRLCSRTSRTKFHCGRFC